jgi:hypothetical protein
MTALDLGPDMAHKHKRPVRGVWAEVSPSGSRFSECAASSVVEVYPTLDKAQNLNPQPDDTPSRLWAWWAGNYVGTRLETGYRGPPPAGARR